MATIIDSLLVTLGLDASAFKKGSKEVEKAQNDLDKDFKRSSKERDLAEKKAADAQKKRAKEVEQYGKKTAETFSKIRNQALGLAAVFTAGMGVVAFTRDTIGSVAALGRLSTMTGVSVNKLAAFGLAFKQIGGNTQEANAAMLKMSNDIASFKAGMPNADVMGFFRFGGKASALKDTQSYMNGLAELLSKLDKRKGTQYAWVVAQQMGVSYNEFQLLRQGPQALDRLIAKNEKLTRITAKSAAAAQVMQEKWADLMESLQQTGRTILFTLAPALQEALGYMQKLASWAITHKATIRQWVDEAVKAVKTFVVEANSAADAVGGWKNVLIALAALKVASIVSPLLSVAAALTRLGLALVGLTTGSVARGLGILVRLGLIAKGGVGLALLTYSSNLNDGEESALRDRSKSLTARQQRATALLQKMGFSTPQALGMVANFTAESGLDPTVSGDGGKAYGLAQWHPDRQASFKKLFGHTMQQSKHPFSEQIAFAAWELLNKYPGVWAQLTGDAGQDAAAISLGYERPANGKQAAATRAKIAQGLAADPIFSMPTGASAGRWGVAGNSTSSNTNISTTIGQITVHTQATDAQGIARSIGHALRSKSDLLAIQGNTGMN